jgi:hypothetical protein
MILFFNKKIMIFAILLVSTTSLKYIPQLATDTMAHDVSLYNEAFPSIAPLNNGSSITIRSRYRK